MISGYVIGESLRPGAVFQPQGLRLRKVSGGLAQALADALEPANGWYADFGAGDERVVVFTSTATRR